MKTWILRFWARDRKNFEEIRNGLKVIETRAATERYQKIKTGDTLIFVCGKLRFRKKVKRIRHFKSIRSMIGAIPYKKIMPSVVSAKEMEKIYYGYAGYREKIKKFGIVALWL